MNLRIALAVALFSGGLGIFAASEIIEAPKRIATVSDVGKAVLWTDQQYRTAKTFEDFERAVTQVSKLVANAKPKAPAYVLRDPEKTGTPREKEWIRTNQTAWNQRGKPDWYATWKSSHSNECAEVQKAWMHSNEGMWDGVGSASDTGDDHSSARLIREASAMMLQYAKSPDLTFKARMSIVETIGKSLSDSEFDEFEKLVIFELFRLVWRERFERGVVIEAIQSPTERTILSKLAAKQDQKPVPPEAFSSFALGVFRAAQNHSDLKAQHVRQDIRYVLKWAPQDTAQQQTTILRLAFGDDRSPNGIRNAGFFRLLYPERQTLRGDADLDLEANEVLNFSELNSKIASSYSLLHKVVSDLTVELNQLKGRMDEFEQRLSALEDRVTQLEYEVNRLWVAIREVQEFTVEYGEFRRDQRTHLPDDSDLTPSEEDRLLRRLAPILLTDLGAENAKERANTETFISPKWLIERCGIVRACLKNRSPKIF